MTGMDSSARINHPTSVAEYRLLNAMTSAFRSLADQKHQPATVPEPVPILQPVRVGQAPATGRRVLDGPWSTPASEVKPTARLEAPKEEPAPERDPVEIAPASQEAKQETPEGKPEEEKRGEVTPDPVPITPPARPTRRELKPKQKSVGPTPSTPLGGLFGVAKQAIAWRKPLRKTKPGNPRVAADGYEWRKSPTGDSFVLWRRPYDEGGKRGKSDYVAWYDPKTINLLEKQYGSRILRNSNRSRRLDRRHSADSSPE